MQNIPRTAIYGIEKKDFDERGITPLLYGKRVPYSAVTHDIVKNADVCIIGSGAAGAIIASELALANRNPPLKVVLLEKGGFYHPEEMNQREVDMMSLLWKNAGATITDDIRLVIIQGQCLGGSTVINDAVCFKTPEIVLKQWKKEEVDIDEGQWNQASQDIWDEINVCEVTRQELNKNNQLLETACKNLKLHGDLNYRNCKNCKQCGLCHLGCHYGTKQDMVVTYIGKAISNSHSDFNIYCNCSVEKIAYREKGASGSGKQYEVEGVDGTFIDRGRNARFKIRINAKVVIISAGAIASSQILLKNNIAVGKAGKGLFLHPASFLLAKFKEEEIRAYEGIPMAYTCDQYSVLKGIEHGGYMIEGVSLPIFQFSLCIPSFAEYYYGYDLMKNLPYYAMAGVMIRDDDQSEDRGGRICLTDSGNAKIHYELTDKDKDNLAEALGKLAELWFSLKDPVPEYLVTPHGRKPTLGNKSEITEFKKLIKDSKASELLLASAHPQGGNRMGDNNKVCVVDSNCKVHDFSNLFVCDASVFPTAVGVNPQITVMTLAKLTADHIKAEWDNKFRDIPIRNALGETCHITQPMFCSSSALDMMFNRGKNEISLFDKIVNDPAAWSFDNKTLMITNNKNWLGLFPKDRNSEFYRLLRYFGKFWKRFDRIERDGTVYGIVHPFFKDLDRTGMLFRDFEFEGKILDQPHPRYGQVIQLKYKNLPPFSAEIYDLIKIIDKDTIIGKAFAGTYPTGEEILVFAMSRKYGVDFMTEDDHEQIFARYKPPSKENMKGRWVARLILNFLSNPRFRAIDLSENFGTINLDEKFRDLLLDDISIQNILPAHMHASVLDLSKWQDYKLMEINPDFMVLKWFSPVFLQQQIAISNNLGSANDTINNSIKAFGVEDMGEGRQRLVLRFVLRREGISCNNVKAGAE